MYVIVTDRSDGQTINTVLRAVKMWVYRVTEVDWLRCSALVSINVKYCTSGPANTWMGDRLRVGKRSRYVANHSVHSPRSTQPFIHPG